MRTTEKVWSNDPCIREARQTDIPGMTELLETLFAVEEDFSFDKELQTNGLKLLLDNPAACLLVAESEGKTVGMCSGQLTISTAEGGPALLVEDVVVREGHRGCGLGRRLMEGIADWAVEKGVSRLQLLADRNNAEALQFYRHLGWQQTELICLRQKLKGI